MEIFGFVVLVLGLIGASLLRRHLRETKQLRLRQMIHEERMRAMEQNLALPEVDDASLVNQFLVGIDQEADTEGRGVALAILWVRIVALCVGLASFFGGIGTCVGMFAASDPEMSNYWSMGLIPTLIGLGLLLFYGLSRSFALPFAEKEG